MCLHYGFHNNGESAVALPPILPKAWQRKIDIPTKPPFSRHYPRVLRRRWQAVHDYFGPVIPELDVFDIGAESRPRLFSVATNRESKMPNFIAGVCSFL